MIAYTTRQPDFKSKARASARKRAMNWRTGDPSFHRSPCKGKCAYCGESTELLIHQECGRRYQKAHNTKKPQKAPKTTEYKDGFIQSIIDNDY